MEKTLIFGGAFDPVHKEHVAMCKSAMQELGISKLVLVPTVTPPHKSAGFLSFQDRCDLLKVAFEGVDFVINDIENAREKGRNKPLETVVINQGVSAADELKKYKDLLDAGVITQEEFDAKKKQLMGM